MVIVTMHEVEDQHLAEVMETAKQVGSVAVNAYYDGDKYLCLEGVHRVEAAKRLGLKLTLVTREWDDVVDCDLQDIETTDGKASVGAIVEYAYDTFDGGVYSDNDFSDVEVR